MSASQLTGERSIGSRLIGWMLAPVEAIERARGRKRVLLLLLYALIAAVVAGGLAWWGQLRGLPDIGEPFDVAAFVNVPPIPADQNAMVSYEEAAKLLRPMDPEAYEAAGTISTATWDDAPPLLRQWLEANRPALQAWLDGTRKPEARTLAPGEYRMSSILESVQQLRTFQQLAVLEATRLEHEGDFAGAWNWLAASLRSSEHAGRDGCTIQRLVGNAIRSSTEAAIRNWASDPNTSPEELRAAIRDMEAMPSDPHALESMMRIEYLIVQDAIGEPNWRTLSEETRLSDDGWVDHLPGFLRLRRFATRDEERSRRVVNLVFAKWLAHCDDPRESRPPLAQVADSQGLELFAVSSNDPPNTRRISPSDLAEWWKTAIGARMILPSFQPILQIGLTGDSAPANALIHVANELYAREHGGTLPSTYAALVESGYLTKVPTGYQDLPSQLPTP